LIEARERLAELKDIDTETAAATSSERSAQ
jgi:hypothetical protein